MNENKIPAHESIEELVEFFDTHDMGDFDLPEAQFEVALPQKNMIVIAPDLLLKLQVIAATRQMTREALVNEWLQEKIAQAA